MSSGPEQLPQGRPDVSSCTKCISLGAWLPLIWGLAEEPVADPTHKTIVSGRGMVAEVARDIHTYMARDQQALTHSLLVGSCRSNSMPAIHMAQGLLEICTWWTFCNHLNSSRERSTIRNIQVPDNLLPQGEHSTYNLRPKTAPTHRSTEYWESFNL